jgi:long-chain acyl-CoA synthetase
MMTPMTPNEAANQTIPELFARTAARCGDRPALGVIKDGRLAWRTWREVSDRVDAWAAELQARGVRHGDRVAQLGGNSEEWIIADLAMQRLGAIHVPLHVALSEQQCAQQISHCGARIVITATKDLSDRIRPVIDGTPIVSHAELASASLQAAPVAANAAEPGDLATILYTSGTTGPPRGVMLTQRNIVTNTVATADAVAVDDNETRLLVLPLSHIYARTCDLYCWIYRGTRLVIAEARESAFRDLKIAKPTFLNAVPYFYQKVAEALRKESPSPDAAALHEFLGGAVKTLFSGGAALGAEVARFFAERGHTILCGYGLTETSPVISASTSATYSPRSVGRVLANIEVRLADDGEILVRGPSVMVGYWQNEEATSAVLHDGWLSTGDLGQWDDVGNLCIVGRKKEMIVLATGKKVAPTAIEQLLAGSPLIEQCCVVGDGRKCLGALVVPNGDELRQQMSRLGIVPAEASALYREEIDRCLKGVAEFEQVGVFTLLDRPFSADFGEVTPKLSLCRKIIERNLAAEIEAMYNSSSCSRTGRLAPYA